MIRKTFLLLFSTSLVIFGKVSPPLPAELADYKLTPAPEASVRLQKGDRLAICGDSITEQKQYSVLMETYLTACLPELEITCRQFGWSGEQAGGFLSRIDNDVLRFKPTVATTCYGMNDFQYVPFDEAIAQEYRENTVKIAQKFKAAGTRAVIGSSGIIDSVPDWVQGAKGDKKVLNLALSQFRNIALEAAETEKVGFADVFQPMLIANLQAKATFGEGFQVSGKDGVHPGWAGHVIMAYAFLKGLGIDGEIGTITWDEGSGAATATDGHKILSSESGKISLESSRLPFAPGSGPLDSDNSIRAGMALISFDAKLNRFILKIANHKSESYTVTWGETSKTYTAEQLHDGINLASEFQENPLVEPFTKIQEAVAAKQDFETKQIKELVHGEAGKTDMEGTFASTEKEREPLVKALADSIQPARHELTIQAK